jgi:hypothetical protein
MRMASRWYKKIQDAGLQVTRRGTSLLLASGANNNWHFAIFFR